MSDLLLMASLGLPRNGLVAPYDPYCDVYGRNVLPANADLFNSGTGWSCDKTTLSAGSLLETATTGIHMLYGTGQSLIGGVTHTLQIEIKANGRNFAYLMPRATGLTEGALLVNLTTGGSSIRTQGRITASGSELLSDGYVRAWIRYTLQTGDAGHFPGVWVISDDGVTYNYAGDAAKGVLLRNPQLNLGAQPFPYSAPAGAPGTLQSMADYWGNLYPLQLGSGTSADAADPAFTGVSMVHAGDYLLSGNIANLTMAGDWTLPIICKPSGTANTLVSLADAAHADQYQAIEFNGSTKVRIKTCNGETPVTSDDLTVSASAVQMLVLTSSGDTLTLKRMDTGASVTATNADPTGTPRLCIGALGVNTVASAADALEWHMLPLYRRAWTAQEAARAYLYSKSLMARRGVTLA